MKDLLTARVLQIIFGGLSETEVPSYNEKVDIWSLGVIVFETLTGRQPFLAETYDDMTAVQNGLLDGENGVRTSLDNIKMKVIMHFVLLKNETYFETQYMNWRRTSISIEFCDLVTYRNLCLRVQ